MWRFRSSPLPSMPTLRRREHELNTDSAEMFGKWLQAWAARKRRPVIWNAQSGYRASLCAVTEVKEEALCP